MLKANIHSVGKTILARKIYGTIKDFISQSFHLQNNVYDYSIVRGKLSSPIFTEEDVIPTLLPNWDETPRRAEGALVFKGATPEQFYRHCKDVFFYLKNKENKFVFLKSWNEWGEGNYIEPCLKYGHGYIKALRRALEEERKC